MSYDAVDISQIAGPDAPVVFNEKGGGQSHVPARFDLIDGKAMFAMAGVLKEGADKYGADNWRKIDVPDHLNHLIMHAYAYLSGDRSDAHLSHIMCRAMFAMAVEITDIEALERDSFEAFEKFRAANIAAFKAYAAEELSKPETPFVDEMNRG